MPELPNPKEILLKAAEMHDKMVDTVTKPVRDFAASVGIELPEPPKASEIVQNLPEPPELPGPESIGLPELPIPKPTTGKKAPQETISAFNKRVSTKVKMSFY